MRNDLPSDNGRQRPRGQLLAALLCVFTGLAVMAPATAAADAITEFGTAPGSFPSRITAGPDGNLWFTDSEGAIGKSSPSGTITEYTAGLNPDSRPSEIAAGPDGNVWFTDPAQAAFDGSGTPAIGRVTPSGAITEFSAAVDGDGEPTSLIEPLNIVAGPDGNLWFTDRAFNGLAPGIGRIEPDGSITKFELNSWNQPERIVSGPDGNLWYTDPGVAGPELQAIGKITPTGTITEYVTPEKPPIDITSGPDGNVWVAGSGMIRKVTPSGSITEYTSGLNAGSHPRDITEGPDGNLWFTDTGDTLAIGRISPSGTITEFSSGLASESLPGYPRGIVTGSDGNLWFLVHPASIGRITPLGAITQFTFGISKGAIGEIVTGPSETDLWFTEHEAIGRVAPVGPAGVSPQPTLAVSLGGSGSGSVSSSPGGIDCGSTCSAGFESGETVTLTADADTGSTFVGWSGTGCSGTGICEVGLDRDTTLSATFSEDDGEAGNEDSAQDSTPPSPNSEPGDPLPPTPLPAPIPGRAFFAKVALVKGNKALIRTRCAGDTRCHGIARLIARVKSKRAVKGRGNRRRARRFRSVLIGKGRFNIAPRKAGVLRFHLTRAGKKLLRRSAGRRRGLGAKLIGRGLKNRLVKLRPQRGKKRQRSKRARAQASMAATRPLADAVPTETLKRLCVQSGLSMPEITKARMTRPGVDGGLPQHVAISARYKELDDACKAKYRRFGQVLVQIRSKSGKKWISMTTPTGRVFWDTIYTKDESGVGGMLYGPSGHEKGNWYFNKTCRPVRAFFRNKVVRNIKKRVWIKRKGKRGFWSTQYPVVRQRTMRTRVKLGGRCT